MSHATPTSNHARIAKNTLFLSLRQLLVMGIALYTSRVILAALGVEDFGIYNVVAGVSTSFLFFSLTLSTSTQRFLSYEMGRGDDNRVRRIFSVCLWSYAAIGAIVALIGAAIGPWLVYDVLNIPPDRMGAALVVFYAMIVSMALTLVFSVYEAVLISRENMKIYAYFGILDAVMKLAIAYIVMVVPQKLITYGLLMVVAMLLPKIIMVVYCYRHYPESHAERIWDKNLLKELFSFAGLNIYSGLVWIINDQGLNVVLNIFFGPVVNAARGVAQQVNSAVVNFSNSFFTAVRPQIIKSYAAKELDEVIKLVSLSSRGSLYLIWVLALPIMLYTPYILSLWLEVVPDHTVAFVRWTLVFMLVNTLYNPLQTVSQATGDLKKFTLYAVNGYLLAFPVAAVILLAGAPAWSVYPVLIITRFLTDLIPLYTLRPYIVIKLAPYITDIIVPIVLVVGTSLAISWGLSLIFPQTFISFAAFACLSVLTTLAVIFLLGLKHTERKAIIAKVLHR